MRSKTSEHQGDRGLTQKESDYLYDTVFGLLDAGEEHALDYLDLFLNNGVNISNKFGKETGVSGQSLYSQIRMLGSINSNLPEASYTEYRSAYKGFMDLAMGKVDAVDKERVGQVYKKVLNYLDETLRDEMEEFEGISGNQSEVAEFLAAVMSNEIIREKEFHVVQNKEYFEDSLESDLSRYSSLYNRLKKTSSKVADRVHVPNSFIDANTVEDESAGKRFKLEDTMEVIAASIGERDLNFKDGDPNITSMVYTLMKHDPEIGERVHDISQVENIVIRENSLYYKTGDGSQKPLKVFGNHVTLDPVALESYQDKHFEKDRSGSSFFRIWNEVKEFLTPLTGKERINRDFYPETNLTFGQKIFSEGFSEGQMDFLKTYPTALFKGGEGEEFNVYRMSEAYLKGPIEKWVDFQSKKFVPPFLQRFLPLPDYRESTFYKDLVMKDLEKK